MENKFGTEKTELVFRKYADMIYRVALHRLANPADAEDILQEVCLALMTKDPPADEEHLKRWLVRVTLNKCSNLRRSFWRRKRESLDDYAHLEAAPEPTLPPELWELDEYDRTVIYLYYFEDYTVPEIAELLGKNVNAVKSRLQRARKRLKKLLTEEGDE